MNDNEIIKALECCVASNCGDCPIFNNKEIRRVPGRCVQTLEKNSLDLINRQQADKEALIAGQESLQKYIAKKQAEIERLERLNDDLCKIADTRKKANFSLLKEKVLLTRKLKAAKYKAIKELLDKIEKQAIPNEDDVYWVELDDIYNLVKEIVGDAE